MSAANELNRWEARAGAGMDAAGRTVYSGPGLMYMGPGEFSATQAVHNDMKARAFEQDPEGMRVRELLDQLKRQRLPGHVSLPVFPLVPGGNQAYDIRMNNAGGGQ
jgi:hypothetical protein